jgi:hypothetical protein
MRQESNRLLVDMDNAARTERWGRLKELFADALQRPSDERDSFVASACGDDTELRLELAGLLVAEAVDDGFIEHPASDTLGWADANDGSRWVGQRIDSLALIELARRADPADKMASFLLAGVLNLKGESQLRLGEFAAARVTYEEAAMIPCANLSASTPDLQLIVACAKAGLARSYAGIAKTSVSPEREAARQRSESLGREARELLTPLLQEQQTKIDAGRQLDAMRAALGWK